MGRTKRRRARNQQLPRTKNLDNENTIICLCSWMKHHKWKNETRLHLRHFETTGRGVFSTKNFIRNDVLIQVPYELLITLNTIQKSDLLNHLVLHDETKLKFQDLLILFLIVEQSKGLESAWRFYIDSLPHEPPWLPLTSPEKLETFPVNVKEKMNRCRWNFEESWTRLRKSINGCNGSGRCVLNVNSFTWAYTMVNTRAVYVDPGIIHELSEFPDRDLRRFLSDEPCMALCPFLDMFNHSCDVETAAELKKGSSGWFYELRTLGGFSKYEQVFISYGSHDNVTLLCEYGFFLPWNKWDTVKFSLNEVLDILNKQISCKQKEFLLVRQLDKDLYVGFSGISFNLKAVLYYFVQCDLNIWATYAFGDSYPMEALQQLNCFAEKLLKYEIQHARNNLCKIANNESRDSDNSAVVLVDFCKYRLELLLHFCKLLQK